MLLVHVKNTLACSTDVAKSADSQNAPVTTCRKRGVKSCNLCESIRVPQRNLHGICITDQISREDCLIEARLRPPTDSVSHIIYRILVSITLLEHLRLLVAVHEEWERWRLIWRSLEVWRAHTIVEQAHASLRLPLVHIHRDSIKISLPSGCAPACVRIVTSRRVADTNKHLVIVRWKVHASSKRTHLHFGKLIKSKSNPVVLTTTGCIDSLLSLVTLWEGESFDSIAVVTLVISISATPYNHVAIVHEVPDLHAGCLPQLGDDTPDTILGRADSCSSNPRRRAGWSRAPIKKNPQTDRKRLTHRCSPSENNIIIVTEFFDSPNKLGIHVATGLDRNLCRPL